MSTRPSLCFIALLFFSPLSAQVEVLQKQSCELPASLKGATGHVLMRYHVNLDGKVNFAEPVFSRVAPADRKAALEEHLKECLSKWTYRAPGKTTWIQSYLELMVAFHYFAPTTGNGSFIQLPDGRRFPRSHLEEMRTMKLELADQFLRGPNFVVENGGAWLLRTNVKKADRTSMTNAIRAAEAAFGKVFPSAPADPNGAPVIVLLFGSQDQFNKISAFDNLFARPQLGGQYIPEERIAYTFATRTDSPLKISHDYLRHEVTHHFIWQRLCGESRAAPYWVNEGVASFIELLRPPRDEKVDRFRFIRGRQAEGGFSWDAKSETYLDAFEQSDRSGSLPDIDTFLRGGDLTIDTDLAYGLSWILVHYLINGENGALYPAFLRWMLGTMGASQDAGLGAAIGKKTEQILPALREHARLMRHRG